ncbi:hypothetical protein BDQ17DRAFT_1366224 [Cyathus striatus]|nr:hypothetical protein BDQ17DRAFT_1366224 [Cyathus striatus]
MIAEGRKLVKASMYCVLRPFIITFIPSYLHALPSSALLVSATVSTWGSGDTVLHKFYSWKYPTPTCTPVMPETRLPVVRTVPHKFYSVDGRRLPFI